MAIKISGDTVIYDNKVFQVGSGTTAQRPTTPATGMIWFNSELETFEGYDGTEWAAVGGGIDEGVLDSKQNVLISGTSIRTINETSILSAGDIDIPGAVFGDPPPPEGVAYAWGDNSNGILGDGTTTNRSSPVSVVGGFTDWAQISVGGSHTAAVRANGSAWAWGSNTNYGRLGDGTTTNRSSPVSVVGGFTDWVQISAGGYGYTLNRHTAAVRSNGTAWAWGDSRYGQLGDGVVGFGAYKSSPVLVGGGFTDWTQISAGRIHTAAVRSNGSAWAWGSNTGGQLGDETAGSYAYKSSPVSVVGGFTDWTQISAGSNHTAAVRANGSAWAWGINYDGTLGDGTTTSRSSPVSVVGGFTDWVQISAGSIHTAAVRANGSAWAWGSNSFFSRLGDGTTTSRSSPVSVVGGFTDWVQISAGGSHTAAVRANGSAWAWGFNNDGRLGDGTTTTRSSPVSVVGGFTDWFQISAGGSGYLGFCTAALKTV